MGTIWNPHQVLDLRGTLCLANGKVRPCENKAPTISERNGEVTDILRFMAVRQPASQDVKDQLERLAYLTLCKRHHRRIPEEVAERREKLINIVALEAIRIGRLNIYGKANKPTKHTSPVEAEPQSVFISQMRFNFHETPAITANAILIQESIEDSSSNNSISSSAEPLELPNFEDSAIDLSTDMLKRHFKDRDETNNEDTHILDAHTTFEEELEAEFDFDDSAIDLSSDMPEQDSEDYTKVELRISDTHVIMNYDTFEEELEVGGDIDVKIDNNSYSVPAYKDSYQASSLDSEPQRLSKNNSFVFIPFKFYIDTTMKLLSPVISAFSKTSIRSFLAVVNVDKSRQDPDHIRAALSRVLQIWKSLYLATQHYSTRCSLYYHNHGCNPWTEFLHAIYSYNRTGSGITGGVGVACILYWTLVKRRSILSILSGRRH